METVEPQFVVKKSVPVLDAHVLERNGERLNIDSKFLSEVVEQCSRREENGWLCPLIVGHTKPGVESPVVGFATNWRLSNYRDRPAIFCDFLVYKDKENVLREYPRRSVELWLQRKEIDPIALLGGSSPERDLGLLLFSKENDTVYRYQVDDNRVEENMDQKMAAEIAKLISETDTFKKIEALLSALIEAITAQVGQQPAESKTEVSTEEASKKEDDEEKKSSEEDEEKEDDEDLSKEELKKRVVALEREKVLIGLRNEGVELDVAEELQFSSSMDSRSFDRYVNHIRKRYSRKPSVSAAVANSVFRSSDELSQEDVNRIVSYATENKLTYEQARRQLYSNNRF